MSSTVALRASPCDKASNDTKPRERLDTSTTAYETPGKDNDATAGEKASNAPLVTPADCGEPKDKQVRFDATDVDSSESPSSASSRGLVSRRGGRLASPGQRSHQSPKEPASVEYQTYRSPTKDEVPSLCSTNSGQLGNDAPDSISCEITAATSTTSPMAQPDSASSASNGATFQTVKSTTPPPGVKLEDRKMSPRMEEKKEESQLSPRRNVQTPTTDFCWDYGKPPTSNGSFDQSNVLAWLQSPTANGMFSPGGYGSIMNTPAARTPGTPTVSTSFFFSDVASLPRAGDSPTKKAAASTKGGVTNIICISPLSTKQRPNGTPLNNYRDVFASPREKAGLPLLSDSATPSRRERLQVPRRSSSKDPSLDAVHLAERDLLEDEDLNVLLQLASNTPRNGPQPVFRSPRRKEEAATEDGEDLPALQLPMIGRDEGKAKSDQQGGDELSRPQLGMRASNSGGPKDMFAKSEKKDKGEADKTGKVPAKNSTMYPMHPPYPGPPGSEHYYSVPPGMPHGPAGSMRVVMGGAPQPRGKGSPPGAATHGMPPHYHEAYSRGGVPYHPPPGMYSQYPPPPYGGMGGYPYAYPPQPARHMPLYGQPPSAKGAAKKPNGNKRIGTPMADKSASAKKQRKSPSSAKRKNKSPQITDKVERQKAAAAIQAVNAASGGKNDKAAALAAAILRGVTMRPSGKWQAQLYFAGKSRYIGVFDSREKAALAYEIAREKLKAGNSEGGVMTPKTTENLVNAARKAAFEGVNEKSNK